MKAEQVIDMQVDLVRRFDNSTFEKVFLATVSQAAADTDNVTALQNTRAIYENAKRCAKHAYAYRVTPDMSTLIEYASSQLNSEDVHDMSLLPTQLGIVRFDKPLPLIDARGATMLIHWAQWGPARYTDLETGIAHNGIQTVFWNDLDQPDEVAQRMSDRIRGLRTDLGRWSIIGVSLLEQGRSLGASLVLIEPVHAAKILADGDTPMPFTNTDRYMHTLWTLLGQTVTDVREEHVRKTSAKAAHRMNIPGRVTVIDLRRMEGVRHEGEGMVEWSHRWVTRGHWRWQPCGTARNEKRRIWIAPFVKGPADKPLVITDKLYNLRR